MGICSTETNRKIFAICEQLSLELSIRMGGGVSQGGIHLQKVWGKNTFRIYDDIALNCLCIINSKRNTTLNTVTEKLP